MAKFDELVRRAVFVRQKGRCASCGMKLNELIETTAMNWIEFHHVRPAALGGDKDEDNCVALCTYTSPGAKDGCHYHVHEEGQFKGLVAAGPEYFKFSHGHEYAKHDVWVLKWNARYAGQSNA